jgi:hypothetical protein
MDQKGGERCQRMAQSQGGQAVSRYKLDPIRIAPPAKGFLIQTPTGKTLFDTRPRGIVMELNRLNDRIKELEAKVDELHDLEKWLEGR